MVVPTGMGACAVALLPAKYTVPREGAPVQAAAIEVKIKGCPPTMPGLAAKLSTPAVTEVAVRVDELVVGDTVYEVEYNAIVG